MLEILCLQVRAPQNSGVLSLSYIFLEQQEQSMHLKYVEKYVPFVNTRDLFETMRQEKPKENLRSTGDKQSVAIV